MNILKNEILDILRVKIPDKFLFTRLGSQNDGGYVLVDNILKTDYLISFGIENNVDFELAMSDIVSGMDLYDFSIPSLPRDVKNSRFFIEKIGSDYAAIFDRVKDKQDLILKIDIEGSEWEFFENLPEEYINKFKQIVVEVHWMLDTPSLHSPDFRIDIIEKINKTHQIVALHPNNYSNTVNVAGIIIPQVLEITFLRKTNNDDVHFMDQDPPKDLFSPNNPYAPEIINYLNYKNT